MSYYLIFIISYLVLDFNFSSCQYITKGITQIINNAELPIIFNANEKSLNIITSGYIYVINKEDNSIKYQSQIHLYLPPFLLYLFSPQNYFLLTEVSQYRISLNSDNEIIGLNYEESLPTIFFDYYGYILQNESDSNYK